MSDYDSGYADGEGDTYNDVRELEEQLEAAVARAVRAEAEAERLRKEYDALYESRTPYPEWAELKLERDALREALEEIAHAPGGSPLAYRRRARAALAALDQEET